MPRTSDVPRGVGAAMALVAGLLVSCADGYPSQDAPPFEPEAMTQAERLDELDALGRPRGTVVRWRYRLDTACRLTVERKERWQAAERTSVALPQVEVALRNDNEQGLFEVVARPEDGDALALYAGKRRVEALRAATLVRLVQRDCAAPIPS